MIPLNDRLLIKPILEEKTVKTGIIVIDKQKKDVSKGVVYSLSMNGSSYLNVGDTVLYDSNSGVEIETEDSIVILIRSEDILIKL